ncbi:calcyphosin-like protein [Aplysia californica]|uniref:Calcyphosin-like protein n=1 Tax=Aplysia californica TaxID=6500 RepID=A0ABM0JVC5_APLCA|nr:calcyphosin-like protein [Aplysia californica]XP_035826695.1 calcyphosin-like protein [Aplysia californica]
MDDDGSKTLSFDEFKKGIRDVGVNLSQEKEYELFRQFDRDGQGTINFDEFLRTVQPQMNDRRKKLVVAAFAKMDKTGDGIINEMDMKNVYNVEKHPKFMSGEWSKTKVLQEYLKTFEGDSRDKDGVVTLDEFMSYYASISCSIDNDAYFDLMMRNSWGMDLGV